MTQRILSWLLHHGNRGYKSEDFYKIKAQILKKYGKHIGYDVQFIEGKKCHSCGGSGIHYYWEGELDYCWHCHQGWYKRPTWVILERVQFGSYTFHQPYERVYKKPEVSTPVIEGYIEHKNSKHCDIARHILFLVYEKGYLKRYYRSAGIGWRCQWWRPVNWVPNIIHLIKKKGNAIPVTDFKKRFKNPQVVTQPANAIIDDDYLPF